MKAAVGFSLLFIATAQAAPSDVSRADALFREAKELLDAGHIAEACSRFEASQKLDRALGTELNLADCWQQAGRAASARKAFLHAAEWAHRNGEQKREAVARERARALDQAVAHLTVAIAHSIDGLEVHRNGVLLASESLGKPDPIDPGSYTIEVTAPGYQRWKVRVGIAPRGETVVDVPELEPLSAPVAPQAEEDAPAPSVKERAPSPRKRPLGLLPSLAIAGFGLAVVSIGVGAAFGIVASGKWSDVQSRCGPQLACDPTGAGWAQDARSFADISTAAFVVAGAAAVTGTVLLLVSRRASREVTVAPVASARLAGFALSGRF